MDQRHTTFIVHTLTIIAQYNNVTMHLKLIKCCGHKWYRLWSGQENTPRRANSSSNNALSDDCAQELLSATSIKSPPPQQDPKIKWSWPPPHPLTLSSQASLSGYPMDEWKCIPTVILLCMNGCEILMVVIHSDGFSFLRGYYTVLIETSWIDIGHAIIMQSERSTCVWERRDAVSNPSKIDVWQKGEITEQMNQFNHLQHFSMITISIAATSLWLTMYTPFGGLVRAIGVCTIHCTCMEKLDIMSWNDSHMGALGYHTSCGVHGFHFIC